MFRGKYPGEELDYSALSSRNAMSLCSAIVEDTEDARQFGFHRRGVLDLQCVVPSASMEIRHGSVPLPSELTSLLA